MSCPTLEAPRMAWRSRTKILGAGSCGGGGGPAARVEASGRAASISASVRVFFMGSVSCGSGEMDDLRSVIFGLDDRQAEVDLDRSEGRHPVDRDAGAGAERQIVLDAGNRRATADRVVD